MSLEQLIHSSHNPDILCTNKSTQEQNEKNKNSSTINILGCNIRSIDQKNGLNYNFIQNKLNQEAHDIILLNEIWTHDTFTPSNPHYQTFQCNPSQSKSKGVMIILRKNFNPIPFEESSWTSTYMSIRLIPE